MKIEPTMENSFKGLEDKVVVFDELARDLIAGVAWSGTEGFKEFREHFVVDETDYPGDPKETYYQGMTFTRLIRRESDGKLFGYSYWQDISEYGETFIKSNGDEHGYDFDTPTDFNFDEDYYPSAYVFLPVKEFSIRGYEVL